MTDSDSIDGQPQISVHTFSQNVNDTTVFFQDSVPLGSQLFGDSTNSVSLSLAQRLGKKTGKQVFVSCNLSQEQMAQPGVERRLLEEMRDRPEVF